MTKPIELRIAAGVCDALAGYHLAAGKEKEALSYAFAEIDVTEDAIRILVPHTAPLFLFDPDCFECQSGGHVRLHKDVLQGLLIRFASSHYSCLINIHDHWFDDHPSYSRIDDADDRTFDRYVRRDFEPSLSRIEGAIARPISNFAIVLGQKGASARLIDTRLKKPFVPISRITIVGDRQKTIPVRKPLASPKAQDARHDRHRDFIAPLQQAALKSLQAVIVGAGGTGSILAEALARIGIGGLTIIDGDTLEETNLNRWQGGEPWMAGQLKALLLTRRLTEMFPDLDARFLPVSVFDPAAEHYLREANVLFGAVDADAPRLFLNRVALQHLIPYFDVGTAVTKSDDSAIDFRSRVFAIYPGTSACLECTSFSLFDREHARTEFLDPATALERQRAGYVQGQPNAVTPSVYALNQRAVGLLVTEFLNWICGFRPAATVVSESWRHGTIERADRVNFPERPDPACPVCGYLAGSGSSEPLPRPAAFATKPRVPVPTTKESSHAEE